MLKTAMAVLAAAGCLATAGCGGGSKADAAHPSGSTPLRIVAASIAPTHAQRPIPPDSTIVEVPALRKTIALTGCQAADGGWSASGTARNPGTATRTYHLLVFFNDRYSRTVNYANTTVRVAGGQSEKWTATAKFSAPAGTQCVLRGLSQS